MLISVVVLGVLASLNPLRPAVFVLVLRTQFVNAIALLIGWAVALSLLFIIVYVALAGDVSAGPGAGQRTAASVAELAIGARSSSSPGIDGGAARTNASTLGIRTRCSIGSSTSMSGRRPSSAC